MKLNKKGSIFDIFLWLILTVFVVLFFAIFIYIFSMFSGVLTSIPDALNANFTEARDLAIAPATQSFNVIYWMAFVMIFMMIVNIFVSNYFIRTHPVFFVIYIFIVGVAIIASVMISNSYESMFNGMAPELQAAFSGFTAVHYILMHLPIWTTIVGVIGLILLFINVILDRGVDVTI